MGPIMHSLLIFDPHEQPFDPDVIENLFRSEPGFQDVRRDPRAVAAVESDFHAHDSQTTISLNENLDTIASRGTSDAALEAALVIRRRLGKPLRMVDTDYSFDLILEPLESIEELRAAIEQARTH